MFGIEMFKPVSRVCALDDGLAARKQSWEQRKDMADSARLADFEPYMNVPIEEVAARQFALYMPWLGDEWLYYRLLCNGAIE